MRGVVYLAYSGNGWVLSWKQDGRTMRLPFERQSWAYDYARENGITL